MSLGETITAGMNNPDCAFYVGMVTGQASAGQFIFKIALVYFGFKLLDKLFFQGIPFCWKRLRGIKQ